MSKFNHFNKKNKNNKTNYDKKKTKTFSYVPTNNKFKMDSKKTDANSKSLKYTPNKNEKKKVVKTNKKTTEFKKKFVFKGKKHKKPKKSNKPKITRTCELCKSQITDNNGTFDYGDNKIICFDCVVKQIREQYNIPSRHKIIYYGAGTFAETRDLKSEKEYFIVKRYQYCPPKHEKFTSNYLPEDKIEKMYLGNSGNDI